MTLEQARETIGHGFTLFAITAGTIRGAFAAEQYINEHEDATTLPAWPPETLASLSLKASEMFNAEEQEAYLLVLNDAAEKAWNKRSEQLEEEIEELENFFAVGPPITDGDVW